MNLYFKICFMPHMLCFIIVMSPVNEPSEIGCPRYEYIFIARAKSSILLRNSPKSLNSLNVIPYDITKINISGFIVSNYDCIGLRLSEN